MGRFIAALGAAGAGKKPLGSGYYYQTNAPLKANMREQRVVDRLRRSLADHSLARGQEFDRFDDSPIRGRQVVELNAQRQHEGVLLKFAG